MLASSCGPVGKDFVYHACGHEFESRLKLLTVARGNPIVTWRKSFIWRMREFFLGVTSLVPNTSLIRQIVKNSDWKI